MSALPHALVSMLWERHSRKWRAMRAEMDKDDGDVAAPLADRGEYHLRENASRGSMS